MKYQRFPFSRKDILIELDKPVTAQVAGEILQEQNYHIGIFYKSD